MGEPAVKTRLSVAEYLAFERDAEQRHEYHDGEIFAMAGGTLKHGALGTNVLTWLNFLGIKSGCTTFNGDAKIRIDAVNRFLYPEASMVCGPIESSEHDPEALINPVLIAEVLSESSEAYDRGEKFRLYRHLPSFREYLLIDQAQPIVSVFFRREENVWEMREIIGLEAAIPLQSLGAEIQMADLYRNVPELGL